MLEAYLQQGRIEAGVDEAGRGPLAGPVYAAAVVLPQRFGEDEETRALAECLNDSKQLTERKRELLRPQIEALAWAWGVGSCSAKEIDEINILNASIKAMHRALDQCVQRLGGKHIDCVLVDGNRFKPWRDIDFQTIVKGDGKMMSIAAASILAKTHHDEYLRKAAARFPQYGWDRNKGYPTRAHREAIKLFGTCEEHRQTFQLLPNQLTLF